MLFQVVIGLEVIIVNFVSHMLYLGSKSLIDLFISEFQDFQSRTFQTLSVVQYCNGKVSTYYFQESE